MNNAVGPVLINTELSRQIIQALKKLNSPVEIEEYGSYIRILVPKLCRLTRQAMEEQTGASFVLPDSLELVMPSFKGQLICSEEEAVWTFGIKEKKNDSR